MRRAVHCVSPLRTHHADSVEVGFDYGGVGGRGGVKGGMVDQEGFVLDGGVGDEVEGGDLVSGDAEILQGGEGCFRGGHCGDRMAGDESFEHGLSGECRMGG